MEFLSYGKQWIDEDDINSVIDVLKSPFLTQGPKIKEFEDSICKYTGAKYCVIVANGTAALHLAVMVSGLGKGDEGITSPNTFAASANCIAYSGGTPVFADIDPRTYNINPDEIVKKISGKTRVIIPVHFAGQPADVNEIQSIAKKNDGDIVIIEDAAHAIGSRYADGSMVGNCRYSDMTIFSFHPVKTITSGEGGAITTNSKEIYDRLLILRSHGITRDQQIPGREPDPWYYEMITLGYNYRMTDIQAALGISQMKKLDSFIKRRREIVKKYNGAFRNIDWLITPYEKDGVLSAFHLYVLQINFDKIGKSRKEVMDILKRNNIGSQVHYIPVHTHPYYMNTFGTKRGDFPKAEAYHKKALSIPLYPKLTDSQVDHVIENVLKLC